MANKIKTDKKYNKLLGFDFSENNLAVVEIQFLKNKINVTGAFTLNIPILQDLNQTVSLIKQNLKSLNIKTKECVFGFSMQYFKFFPVPIPKTIPPDEIGSIIIQEGGIDVNGDFVTWIPLNNTQRQDPDGIARYDVLGISMPKSVVDAAKFISSKTGLSLISVTPSFLGVGSFLSATTSPNLISTLWISQIKSELVVWSGQEPIYEHLFFTHQINEQIFQSVNHIQTQLPGAQVSTIFTLGPFIKDINLSQVPFNIQEFSLPQTLFDLTKIEQRVRLYDIVLPLSLALSASNNFPYKVPNLLFPVKPKIEPLKGIFKDISKARPSISLKSLDPLIIKYVLASIAILVFSLITNFFINIFLVPNVLATSSVYENRISLAQAHLAKVLTHEKTNKVLSIKVDYLSELVDKRKPWSKILREVGDMAPKELWIDRLEVKNNNVDIFGRALNVDAVANFSINLNHTAKSLTKAQIIALRKFQEEGFDIIEFQVSARLNDLIESVKNKLDNIKSKITTKT